MKISPHFDSSEFRCKDARRTPAPAGSIPALRILCRDVLEPMRLKFGICTVMSGYRTPSHNRKVDGATNSRHLYGRFPKSPAADVYFQRGSALQWRQEARRLLGTKRGGVGTYSGVLSVHVDLRPFRADW